ncbi:biofilm PGA synthesis protein PgaA [Actinobacillus equuli]|nr:biofilm PGA synthesis protein PgaA [Actinobacillus equuli]
MHLVPGDPWTMLALSDLESSRNNHDRANFLADKASHFLGESDQGAYKISVPISHLVKGIYEKFVS